MTLPRQGLGLGVVAALAVAALSSCQTTTKESPVSPVVIPVELDVKPVAQAVEAAKKATDLSKKMVDKQSEAISDAKLAAKEAEERATRAYHEGLAAGSKTAQELGASVSRMAFEIDELDALNMTLVTRVDDILLELKAASDNVFELQHNVGQAESALKAQTQIAAQNKRAFDDLSKLYDAELVKRSAAEEGRKIARKWALWLGISLAITVALIVTYISAKTQGWFTRF